MLDPRAPDALARTERAFRELGMRALCLFPAMHHFRISETSLHPILDEVASHDGIVFVHCGELSVGVRDKLGLPSPFDASLASPRELGDVAPRFASLPFVVPHFGGDRFHDLMEVARAHSNVFVDTSSSNSWMERLSEPLTLSQVFQRVLEVLGPNRILYGSDSSFFPRGWNREHFRAQAAALAELELPREGAALVLGDNLERLLKARDLD